MSDYQALHMIEALRSGISSREVGRYFSDARFDLLRRIEGDLEEVKNEKSSKGLIISGRYGEGKTHLLQTVFSMASEKNMVVSMVSLGKESPMDKVYVLYRKIMENTYLPGREQPGFFSQMDNVTPQSAFAKDMLLYALTKLTTNRLYYLFRTYLSTEQFEDRFRLQADLEGDFIANATVKEMHNAIFHEKKLKIVFSKTRDYGDYFAFMSELFRRMGYGGWVILFDEAELIGRFGRKARTKAYRAMRRFLVPPETIRRMYSLFVFGASYKEDVIEGKNEKMEAERYFIEDGDRSEIPAVIDAIAGATELKPLTKEEVLETIDKIRTLHGKAYDWTPKISTRDLETRTSSHGFVLRTRLRAAIECLDQLYQYGSIGETTIRELQSEKLREEENAEVLDGLLKKESET